VDLFRVERDTKIRSKYLAAWKTATSPTCRATSTRAASCATTPRIWAWTPTRWKRSGARRPARPARQAGHHGPSAADDAPQGRLPAEPRRHRHRGHHRARRGRLFRLPADALSVLPDAQRGLGRCLAGDAGPWGHELRPDRHCHAQHHRPDLVERPGADRGRVADDSGHWTYHAILRRGPQPVRYHRQESGHEPREQQRQKFHPWRS
jgi:hypothetical protein